MCFIIQSFNLILTRITHTLRHNVKLMAILAAETDFWKKTYCNPSAFCRRSLYRINQHRKTAWKKDWFLYLIVPFVLLAHFLTYLHVMWKERHWKYPWEDYSRWLEGVRSPHETSLQCQTCPSCTHRPKKSVSSSDGFFKYPFIGIFRKDLVICTYPKGRSRLKNPVFDWNMGLNQWRTPFSPQ